MAAPLRALLAQKEAPSAAVKKVVKASADAFKPPTCNA
jgi:hypothetical protein